MTLAADEFDRFVAEWPEYAASGAVESLRSQEFARLDLPRHVYLDYTGAGLYGESQVREHMDLLLGSVLGNPHSENPASHLSTHLVEGARRHVLSFFNAPEQDYYVIFTANASHALKLVGESYPFGPASPFVLTFDNHNSVNGIREFARARGAAITYIPVVPPDMRVDRSEVDDALSQGGGHGLFPYPAQSNFSGVQHDLDWISAAQAKGWDVLLDAAAFVPTNRLDLTRWRPDFVVVSFYKIFGYPTGVGALIARRSVLARLHRPWFAGGTITVASVGADQYHLASGASGFEDGTPNFSSLAAVDIGLSFVERIGINAIHHRVRALTGWLLGRLLELRHTSGRPLVTIYGPADMKARGATITLNFQDGSGGFLDHQVIEAKASEHRISIRSGCFCNPGAGEVALGISPDDMKSCFARSPERMTYDDFRRCVDGRSSGAVRVSLGLASNFADVSSFLAFARGLLS